MRTNIVIEDALLAEAMALTRAPTKRATVEQALRVLIQSAKQRSALDDLAGIGWDGDLDALRAGRDG